MTAEDKETGPKPFDGDLYDREIAEIRASGDDPHSVVTTPEGDYSMDNIVRATPASLRKMREEFEKPHGIEPAKPAWNEEQYRKEIAEIEAQGYKPYQTWTGEELQAIQNTTERPSPEEVERMNKPTPGMTEEQKRALQEEVHRMMDEDDARKMLKKHRDALAAGDPTVKD